MLVFINCCFQSYKSFGFRYRTHGVIDVIFQFLFLKFESSLLPSDTNMTVTTPVSCVCVCVTVALFTLLTGMRTNLYPVEMHQSCLCKSCIDLSDVLTFHQPSLLTPHLVTHDNKSTFQSPPESFFGPQLVVLRVL